jgi:hypothetical protein
MLKMFLSLFLISCIQEPSIYDPRDPINNSVPPDLETPVVTDVIVQTVEPQVDILWIIDNSCSMAEEQAKLVQNFPVFMQFFIDSGLDWHVGVVSTDTYSDDHRGKLQGSAEYRFLTPASPDPVALFSDMATLGTMGSGIERGRRAAYHALIDPLKSGYNRGFYRDEASLNLIVISDEDDYSESNPSREEFISFLTALKEDPELVTFSSIVGPIEGCPAAYPGPEYISVSEAVGGIVRSICYSDWAPALEELGLQAAGLRREYFLSQAPVVSSLDVQVQDGDYHWVGINAAQPTSCPSNCFSYQYDIVRNSITMLDYVPSQMAKIVIEYKLLSAATDSGF